MAKQRQHLNLAEARKARWERRLKKPFHRLNVTPSSEWIDFESLGIRVKVAPAGGSGKVNVSALKMLDSET